MFPLFVRRKGYSLAQVEALIAEAGGDPADSADDVNLLYNGRFESELVGVEGWYTAGGGVVTRTRETVSPLAGNASLKVVTNGALGGQGVESEAIVLEVFQGCTLELSFLVKGSGTLMANMLWNVNDEEIVWTAAATGTTQEISVEFDVPLDESGLTVQFLTDWAYETAATWYLDDIRLIKIANPA
jgi:hypothetical protein